MVLVQYDFVIFVVLFYMLAVCICKARRPNFRLDAISSVRYYCTLLESDELKRENEVEQLVDWIEAKDMCHEDLINNFSEVQYQNVKQSKR